MTVLPVLPGCSRVSSGATRSVSYTLVAGPVWPVTPILIDAAVPGGPVVPATPVGPICPVWPLIPGTPGLP